MATQKFANNASAVLAATINATDTTIQVASGFGTLFPSPGAGEFFLVALQNAAGDLELVKISSRTGDILTVSGGVAGRAQEGTSAAGWTLTVTRVELRLTRDTMARFVQKEGSTVVEDLVIPNLDVTTLEAATSITVAAVSVTNAALFTTGSIGAGRVPVGAVTQHQAALALDASQLTGGSIPNARVTIANVTQHQASLAIAGTQLTSGSIPDGRVPLSNVSQHSGAVKTRNVTNLAGTAVTLQADPGGTPSGSPGEVFLYF